MDIRTVMSYVYISNGITNLAGILGTHTVQLYRLCNRGLLSRMCDVKHICLVSPIFEYLACRAVGLLNVDLARASPTGSIACG